MANKLILTLFNFKKIQTIASAELIYQLFLSITIVENTGYNFQDELYEQ